MRKETDLDGVKAIAKALLITAVNETLYTPMIVQHPFTSTGLIPFPTEMNKGFQPVDITLNEDNLKIWRESVSQIIDEAENPYHIYMLLNPPYAQPFSSSHLPTLLKLAHYYIVHFIPLLFHIRNQFKLSSASIKVMVFAGGFKVGVPLKIVG